MELFSDIQLKFIRSCAERCEQDNKEHAEQSELDNGWQDDGENDKRDLRTSQEVELSVGRLVRTDNDGRLSDQQLDIVDFCAEECMRQMSGEMSVWRMVEAYNLVMEIKQAGRGLEPDDIVRLLSVIEPGKNPMNRFRTNNVQIKWQIVGWENIPQSINSLLFAQTELSPHEFYMEFETIHPGNDGNGRLGAILFNFLKGTLDSPETAPEYRHPTMSVME